ncbi:rhodanese-like domain-containing protein [Prolixibacteraceae bacterium]|nr:rhodanese-like domain-containing protein [Prolixibacteraceae bacterium]
MKQKQKGLFFFLIMIFGGVTSSVKGCITQKIEKDTVGINYVEGLRQQKRKEKKMINNDIYLDNNDRRVKKVTVIEASELIGEMPELTIIDARSSMMYNAGHIEGAQLLDAFSDNTNKIVAKLDKNRPYLVYCTTHVRSDMLVKLMYLLNFKEVYMMDEGIEKWKASGMPVVK